MLQVTPFHYDQIYYNEAIDYQERDWNRKMDDHERNLLIQGYRLGRLVQVLEQWKAETETAVWTEKEEEDYDV